MITTTTMTLYPNTYPASSRMNPALDADACQRRKCGRPKGTNDENKISRTKAYNSAVDGAAQNNPAYLDAHPDNQNNSPWKLNILIQEEKKKKIFSDNISLSK